MVVWADSATCSLGVSNVFDVRDAFADMSTVEGSNVITERPINNDSNENDIDVQVHTVHNLNEDDNGKNFVVDDYTSGVKEELKHAGGSVGPEYEALKRAEYEKRLKEDIERAAKSKKKVVLHVHHKPGTRDWINSKFFGRARKSESESEGSSPMKPTDSTSSKGKDAA